MLVIGVGIGLDSGAETQAIRDGTGTSHAWVMVYLAVGIVNVVLAAMFFLALRLLRDPSPKGQARRSARRAKKAAKLEKKQLKAGIPIDAALEGVMPLESAPSAPPMTSELSTGSTIEDQIDAAGALSSPGPDEAAIDSAMADMADPHRVSRRRFVPGGPPLEDGGIPDFSLSLSHLFVSDNGVQNPTRRRSAIDPIRLSIQAGARPVTPLLERVVRALVDIGLEPAQTRPLVHSFIDSSGRSARVRLGHSEAQGDMIEIEIEPSLSPAAMASVMQLLAELDFDPNDMPSGSPTGTASRPSTNEG